MPARQQQLDIVGKYRMGSSLHSIKRTSDDARFAPRKLAKQRLIDSAAQHIGRTHAAERHLNTSTVLPMQYVQVAANTFGNMSPDEGHRPGCPQ